MKKKNRERSELAMGNQFSIGLDRVAMSYSVSLVVKSGSFVNILGRVSSSSVGAIINARDEVEGRIGCVG